MATVNPLLQQIDAIAKEKGVEPDIIISAVQDAHRSGRAQALQERSAAGAVQSARPDSSSSTRSSRSSTK